MSIPENCPNYSFILEMQIIPIHHECPCRIWKSHPRNGNFNQSRGLPSLWLKFQSQGCDFLFYMGWLMMDYFSPTFSKSVPHVWEIAVHMAVACDVYDDVFLCSSLFP